MGLGYEYDTQVRTIGGRLRSFGTLDEPFAYAAFLLFGLCAALFWFRRSRLAVAFGATMALGLLTSQVRSAAIVSVALLGIWLAQKRLVVLAGFILAGAVITAATVSRRAARRNADRDEADVRVDLSDRQRANGSVADRLLRPRARCRSAKASASSARPRSGRSKVRRSGSRRNEIRLRSTPATSPPSPTSASPGSSWSSSSSDASRSWPSEAAREGKREGWFAIALLVTLSFDAVTRSSFTAFPTAFLGFLLVGLALAAARDEEPSRAAGMPAECRRSVALFGLVAAGSSGVSRYATSLTRALGEVAHEFPALDLRLLTTAAGAERIGPVQLDVHDIPAPTSRRARRPGTHPAGTGLGGVVTVRPPALLRRQRRGLHAVEAFRRDDPRCLCDARVQRRQAVLQATAVSMGAEAGSRDRRDLGVREERGNPALRRDAGTDHGDSVGPRLHARGERRTVAGTSAQTAPTSCTWGI